jgi:hypothetical protein
MIPRLEPISELGQGRAARPLGLRAIPRLMGYEIDLR